MHHWEVGGAIAIGWPDYDVAEREYTIVELERYGPVLRGRVSDGQRQGGFLVVFGCPDLVLEMLARRVSAELGLRWWCRICGAASRERRSAASTTNGIPPRNTPNGPAP